MFTLARLVNSLKIRFRIILYKTHYRIKNFYIRNQFDDESWCSGEVFTPNWLFHDESWDLIKKRWEYRGALIRGDNVEFDDVPQPITHEVNISKGGDICFKGKTTTKDEWLFLYLSKNDCLWTDYSFEFDAVFNTVFKEFQIDFRYFDFFNRYRYRFQNGKLFFDVVYNGEFFASLSSYNFDIKVGRSYKVVIKVMGEIFQCWINDKLISTDFGLKTISTGTIAIILWEDNGTTDLGLLMNNIKLKKLTLANKI